MGEALWFPLEPKGKLCFYLKFEDIQACFFQRLFNEAVNQRFHFILLIAAGTSECDCVGVKRYYYFSKDNAKGRT